MDPFSPIVHLPVAEAILNTHQDTTLTAQRGNYRIQNAGSGRCLSYITRQAQAQASTQAKATVTGWSCRVPGNDDDLNQIWTVRVPPENKNAPPAFSKSDPKVYIFEATSPLLSTTSGGQHQYRLDLVNDAPAVIPVNPSGRSSIPNGLNPPQVPEIPFIPSTIPTPPPTPDPFPALDSYAEILLASPKGATTSLWQILQIQSDKFDNKYLLFNPSNRLYAGHTPTWSTSSLSTSVVTETAADGTPIQAVALERYLKDLVVWLDRNKNANWKTVIANIDAQLQYFVWSFQRADFGPAAGGYRIVHDKTMLAIDGLQRLTAAAISPQAKSGMTKSQVWDIVPTASGTAAINYSVFNHASQNPLYSGKFRLLFIPPVKAGTPPVDVDTALAIPDVAPTAPTQFLLMDIGSMSLIGFSQNNDNNFASLRLSGMALPSEGLEDVAPHWDNIVVRHMVERIATFRRDHDYLVWRLYPESWSPDDGIYSFSNGPSSLDIPPTTSSAVLPLSLSLPYPFPSAGSAWWRLTSMVDHNSGAIYQTVTNYRSGHAVDVSGITTTTKENTDAAKQTVAPKDRVFPLIGRRLGGLKNEKWRLVAAKDGDTSYAFQDFATYGKGTFVQSGVCVYGPSVETNAIWTVRKVDFDLAEGLSYNLDRRNLPDSKIYGTDHRDIPDGQYLILNLALNSFLSVSNTVNLNETPMPWNIVTNPKGREITTGNGAALGTSSGNAVLTSGPSPITLIRDAAGGFLIRSTSGSTILTGSSNSVLVFSPLSASLSQRWKILAMSDPRTWTVPSWLGFTRLGDIPNLPDGVYRMTNRQSKATLFLADNRDDQLPCEVLMTNSAIEASFPQLWYIERNRDFLLQPMVQTYTITNMSRKVSLQERLADVGQPAEGLNLYAERDGHSTPAVITTQRWMFWKASNNKTASDKKASANGWILQAAGGSGGLLDYSKDGILSTRPQLEAAPTATQVWQLDSVQSEISSGFYSLRNTTTQSFLSLSPGSPITTSNYNHSSSDWKLVSQPNGLYTLQTVTNLLFVTGTKGLSTTTTPEYWMLAPSKDGVVLQHSSSRMFLTDSKGTVNLSNVGTQWALKRVDNPSPAFNEQPSDKVPPAKYSIVNTGTSQTLNWPSSPTLGTTAVGSKTGPRWTIIPTAGYYSISLSSLTLGTGARASPEFLDSSMWKLVKFDTGNYRIINRSTGLLLAQDAKASVIEQAQETSSGQRDEWEVVQDPSTVVKSPAVIDREIPVTNGIYTLSNLSTSQVINLPKDETPLTPVLSPRDLDPYSVASRTQLWIIEQLRDGWYIIKSFPWGFCLGYTTSLICASDDTSDSFRWNFIQDRGGQVRCVAKTDVTFALSSAKNLSVVKYSGDASQWWKLDRISGTPSDAKLPQGTYLISQFISPKISALQSQAAAMSFTLKSDKVTKMVSEVSNSYGSASASALPTSVDTNQVTVSLTQSDNYNAVAVATIVVNFYGALYVASAPPKQTPSNSSDPKKASAPSDGKDKAVPARTIASSDANKKIGDLLVEYCKKSVDTAPTSTVQQINDICTETQLLTDLTARVILNDMISSGQTIIAQLDTYIQTLNTPAVPAAPAAPAGDPDTPLTLTLNNGSLVSPLIAQSLSQYFLIESFGDGFSISHLTSKQYISVINNIVVLSPQPFPWTISLQRLGGYAIFSDNNTILKLLSTSSPLLTIASYVPDGLRNEPIGQRWQLRRTGYYLQNQGEGNFSALASANTDNNGVSLKYWQPFSQTVPAIGPRSDACNTWHMDKIDNGKYRLYNEHSRTSLRGPDDSHITLEGTNSDGSDLWQFAKNNNDLWLQCQNSKNWLALDGSRIAGSNLNLDVPGNQEKWKGWQLVSLAATERGLLTSLPRFALLTDKQQVYSDLGPTEYVPDNSHQRYRSYTYGDNTIFINEATTTLLKSDGTTIDLMNTNDPLVWWTFSTDKKTATSKTGALQLSTTSNTGDLVSSNLSLRIELSNGKTFSVSDGNLVAEDFDRMSTAQVWSYLDWQQGRYIVHVETSKMLGISGTSLTLFPPNAYSSSTLWTIDTASSSSPNNNGLFPLRPVTKPSFCIQPDGTLSSNTSGTRFVKDSTWLSFTTRASVLQRFISTHAPVFCHDTSTLLPLSIEAYLAHCTPNTTPATPPAAGTNLTYNGPPSDGSQPTTYITIRDSPDAAYINYTDFTFSLLYASGWAHVTLRYNNETNNLESASFPSLNWIYNLDSNYATCLSIDNPLQLLRRADGMTRLHVYVGAGGAMPTFPQKMSQVLSVEVVASPTDQIKYITDDSSWTKVVDAGSNVVNSGSGSWANKSGAASGGNIAVVVEASMIADDETGAGITPPDWAGWGASWGGTTFP